MTWLASMSDAVERHFRAAADPERAEPMQSYMRDQFPFYGIGAQERRDVLKTVWSEIPLPADEKAIAMVVRDWIARPQREWHQSAVTALRRHGKILSAASWPTVRHVATTNAWWDTVDELAKNVAGRIVKNDPAQVSVMDEWVRSDDMWVARVAILHQLGYTATTDVERLFGYCDLRADEADFFYRKAIGWALRQYAHEDPAAVAAYVDSRRDRLSPLSIREATKNL